MKASTKYAVAAYLVFWAMVLGICGTASMVFHAPPLVMRWLSNLCAWSPTLVLLVMVKRLLPGTTIRDFYKNAFRDRLRPGLLLLLTVAIAGGTVVSALLTGLLHSAQGREFTLLFRRGAYPIPLTVVLSLLSGPTGEEAGWRGYLRPELEKRLGFWKGTVTLGVIWAFWHTVLWFVDSDFTGWSMAVYIISNVVVMTALNIIMSCVLERHNNLAYAIWIHFCFNLTYGFIQADIWFYAVMTAVFIVLAAAWALARQRYISRKS